MRRTINAFFRIVTLKISTFFKALTSYRHREDKAPELKLEESPVKGKLVKILPSAVIPVSKSRVLSQPSTSSAAKGGYSVESVKRRRVL